MKTILSLLFLFITPILANEHCSFELKTHRVSPNEVILGITLTPKEGWHTYWSNPGESGLAPSIELEDAGVKVLAEEFPVPKRYARKGIITYEYSQSATFLYSLSGEIPEDLKGQANWLVCDDNSCLPADAAIDLKVSKRVSEEQPGWLKAALASQPKALEVESSRTEVLDKNVTFIFKSPENLGGWDVYPYSGNLKDLQVKVEKTNAPVKQKKSPESVSENTEKSQEESSIEKLVEGDYYKIKFQVVEELPKSLSFLVTDGTKAYRVEL